VSYYVTSVIDVLGILPSSIEVSRMMGFSGFWDTFDGFEQEKCPE